MRVVLFGVSVISNLKETRRRRRQLMKQRSTAKYHSCILELESLQMALSRPFELQPGYHELAHPDAIRAAAGACQRPLEAFL